MAENLPTKPDLPHPIAISTTTTGQTMRLPTAATSFCLLTLAAGAVHAQSAKPEPLKVTVYRNARVWDGEGFRLRTLFIGGDRFLSGVPEAAIASEENLDGKFVIPALGSAHEHSINPNAKYDWAYFSDGVFYLWNANSIVTSANTRDYYRRGNTVDVATAMGGISEPDGHPEVLYTDVLTKYVYKGTDPATFKNNAYHYGRTRKEIDDALDRLLVQGADFVKAMLLFSEDYEARKKDPSTRGARGLNPAIFPYLVQQARRRGLWTYVHVETTADVLTAAKAGAAVAGHLPAFYDVKPRDLAKMRISDRQARIIVKSGMMVIPTYSVARFRYAQLAEAKKLNVSEQTQVYAVQGANLRALYGAGAIFLTGTDFSTPIADEVKQWVEVGGMPANAALRAALSTGRRMFPSRRIGCFDPGCEADFLVLSANPLVSLDALQSIERRVKAGVELSAPRDEEANPAAR